MPYTVPQGAMAKSHMIVRRLPFVTDYHFYLEADEGSDQVQDYYKQQNYKAR